MTKVLKLSQILEPKNLRVGDMTIQPMSCTNEGIFLREEKFSKNLSKSLAKNKIAHKGDFIFGMSRKILNFGMMKFSEGSFSSAYKVYKCKFGYEFSVFLDLYIRLNHDYFFQCISGGAREGQSISEDILFNLEVNVPDNNDIENLVRIVDFFNSKIELYQQTNETLEEIVKTLFKSWFIDFDPVRAKAEGRPTGLSKEISDLFPDAFEDSELGEIPKGWRIESFSHITSFKNGFAFKSKDWTEFGKPVVKIGNVKPLILDIDGCSFISDDIKKYDEYLLSKGDILIGMTGYVGETCLVPKLEKMPYQNQRVGKLIPTKDFFKEFIFSFTRQSNFKKNVEEIAQGSAQQNVSGKDILGLHFVFGNEEILKIFSDSTSDLFKKILLNFEENITLAMLRDTLLPKLISGELEILDAENLIEEAGV